MISRDGVAEESTHYITVVNTATWGVSKAYAFLFLNHEAISFEVQPSNAQ